MNISSANILLVNDDGIDAPGIQALRRELEPHCNLRVVAPYGERSAAGCSLSLSHEIAVRERFEDGRRWGWSVNGTPADCVKFALTALDGYRPDLVLSGINRGQNVGNSIWYSGTVAAALEATMFGMRAMAVSLGAFRAEVLHFDSAARLVRGLIPWLLDQPWQQRTLWNLNVPNCPLAEIRGIRFAHQGTSFFVDNFAFSRSEEGVAYYRNVGEHLQLTPEPTNSDDLVLEAGSAALSLLNIDLTIEVPDVAARALEARWDDCLGAMLKVEG